MLSCPRRDGRPQTSRSLRFLRFGARWSPPFVPHARDYGGGKVVGSQLCYRVRGELAAPNPVGRFASSGLGQGGRPPLFRMRGTTAGERLLKVNYAIVSAERWPTPNQSVASLPPVWGKVVAPLCSACAGLRRVKGC